MTTLRVFFAIDLPSPVQDAVQEVILKLQKHHKREPIRWTKSHNLHITLQFMAALKEEDKEALITNMQQEIVSFGCFELQLNQVEMFPTPYHSRIIALTMQPQNILSDLSNRMGGVIKEFGYEIEERPFRGHLTLARLQDPKHFMLGRIEQPQFKKFKVNEILLYHSQPHAGGSHYTVLNKFSLRCANHE